MRAVVAARIKTRVWCDEHEHNFERYNDQRPPDTRRHGQLALCVYFMRFPLEAHNVSVLGRKMLIVFFLSKLCRVCAHCAHRLARSGASAAGADVMHFSFECLRRLVSDSVTFC